MGNILTYTLEDKLYINLTNRCSNNCDFCVRNYQDGVGDYYLWLDREPTAEEVIRELSDLARYQEVVFCGYGEPMYAYDTLIEVAKYLKQNGKQTRLNTNGQATLILGRDVTRELGEVIDTVSISLNATDAEAYDKVCHSLYGEGAYDAMLAFARGCVKHCKRVILSVVEIVGAEEIERARKIAEDIGAELRVRSMI